MSDRLIASVAYGRDVIVYEVDLVKLAESVSPRHLTPTGFIEEVLAKGWPDWAPLPVIPYLVGDDTTERIVFGRYVIDLRVEPRRED